MLRWLIWECLRRVRRAQGRSLRDVAQEAGVSIGHLSEVERGRKEASSEVLAAICRALGLSLADLLRLAQLELARWRTPRMTAPGVRVVPAVPRTGPARGRDVAAAAGRVGVLVAA